jgi:hypothetical protein
MKRGGNGLRHTSGTMLAEAIWIAITTRRLEYDLEFIGERDAGEPSRGKWGFVFAKCIEVGWDRKG